MQQEDKTRRPAGGAVPRGVAAALKGGSVSPGGAARIRDEIAENRRRRIEAEGHSLGVPLPPSRKAPPAPFGRTPFVICEMKRRSPSKGAIAPDLDARAQAAVYAARGIRTVSVLTEEDYFGGSLADLMAVKERFPDIAVLRKDFLLEEEDIEVSWRAGADAVLLIAGMLDAGRLRGMYTAASRLGMECLVEVHSEADVEKLRSFEPRYVGINSRNLQTFRVDLLGPMETRRQIGWEASAVFESGIRSGEEAVTALDGGFSGLLVGESVVRDSALIPGLTGAFAVCGRVQGKDGDESGSGGAVASGKRSFRFWPEVAARRGPAGNRRPLVKICGITNTEDAETAVSMGADILGFVFAESPRKADTELPGKLRRLRALRVAVVTGGPNGLKGPFAGEISRMLAEGDIDAVQFHGDEHPEACFSSAYPYYKAVRVRDKRDTAAAEQYRCPRVLFDAFQRDRCGGTGKTIPGNLLETLPKEQLWLAGGLGPDSVRGTLRAVSPELIDASSLLEECPGKKDPAKLKKFFQEIEHGLQ